MFLGATAGATALGSVGQAKDGWSRVLGTAPAQAAEQAGSHVPFMPVQGPMPVSALDVPVAAQPQAFAQYAVQDDLVLPEGYTYDLIGAWGDRVGDSRFGYNNDYLSLVETAPGEGYLTINFEYISGGTWMQTYREVIGADLPFAAVIAAAAVSDGEIDVATLADNDPLKAQIVAISKEAMIDQGIGVISLRREADGRWVRTYSDADRRITGISGLEDGRYLSVTGPAAAVFNKANKLGYEDNLGARIIGTFQNCAGGTTPWGTVLSAEENFQDQVYEPVMADGSAYAPSEKKFIINDGAVDGRGNVFGLAGNKYGWMVEVDPANPNDYGVKHSWLGRFRHEAVAVRAVAGRKLAVYSGCDRRGGHVYKFVSNGTVLNPRAKTNSRLMGNGKLYAAKFNPDGTGTWIPLEASTPVNPDLPSRIAGGMITLPNRPEGGFTKVDSDATVRAFTDQFATLGDLYRGNREEQQGAILIDAHYAANAAGATPTARPEDTDVDANGNLFIAFTSGGPGGDGGPNNDIFQGPQGQEGYEHGWIMKVMEDDNDPAALTFRWDMLALGGEPSEGGMGFSNPDNLEIDSSGNLWMVTDMSTSRHNKAVPSRVDADGNPVSDSNLRGLFGNNSVWYMPVSGPNAGEAYMFAYGPMESEICGPYLTRDQSTLFLAAQHPGETHGLRQDMAMETRAFAMKTTEGDLFMQAREVPLGSNWPAKTRNAPPRPATVAVRKIAGGPLV
jgi:secreted PhoX family phosphatase